MGSDELADAIAQAYVPKYLGDAGASELTACDGHRVIAAWLRSPEGRAVVARALGLVDFLDVVKRDGELWKLGFKEGQRVPFTCPRCDRTWPTAYCKYCGEAIAERTGDGDEHR